MDRDTERTERLEPEMEALQERTVSSHRPCVIKKVANGFILEIGRKWFVAKTWGEAAFGLGEYWEDPLAAEKKYTK